jgi:uncharacterized protein with HEPN domain
VKDDALYLIHIGECIARIEGYTREGERSFLEDTKTQDAVVRNLHTLADSTQRVSPELKARHPEVDWRGPAGLRNVLVHGYLGIDLERVWAAVERELPALKAAVEAMKKER